MGRSCATMPRMTSVIKLFWNLCLLRIGPDSVPAHAWFVTAAVMADIALSTFVNTTVSDVGASWALGWVVVSLATVAAVTWLILSIRGLTGRFPATLAALAGTDFLLTVIPAILAPIAAIQTFVLIAVQIWLILVWGFIFRHSFNISLAFGIVIAFGVSLLSTIVAGAAIGFPVVEEAGAVS